MVVDPFVRDLMMGGVPNEYQMLARLLLQPVLQISAFKAPVVHQQSASIRSFGILFPTIQSGFNPHDEREHTTDGQEANQRSQSRRQPVNRFTFAGLPPPFAAAQ